MKVIPLLKCSFIPILQGTQVLPYNYCKLFPPIKNCSLIVRSITNNSQANPYLLKRKSNQSGVNALRYFSDEVPQNPRRRPSLFFVQNPFTWLVTKLDFIMLKNSWDPEFNEQGFRVGTKQV
jgi:hypothetical protein